MDAMPEVIIDKYRENDDEWVWYDYDSNKVYLNA